MPWPVQIKTITLSKSSSAINQYTLNLHINSVMYLFLFWEEQKSMRSETLGKGRNQLCEASWITVSHHVAACIHAFLRHPGGYTMLFSSEACNPLSKVCSLTSSLLFQVPHLRPLISFSFCSHITAFCHLVCVVRLRFVFLDDIRYYFSPTELLFTTQITKASFEFRDSPCVTFLCWSDISSAFLSRNILICIWIKILGFTVLMFQDINAYSSEYMYRIYVLSSRIVLARILAKWTSMYNFPPHFLEQFSRL